MPAKVLVFCNIGTRDIELTGETLAPPFPSPRQRGQNLLDQAHQDPTFWAKLRLVVSDPPMKEVLQQVNQIDQLVCIGTDQPPPPQTLPRHYQNDTIFYAQLATTYFQHQYPGRIAQISTAIIHHRNPSLYDAMMEWYGQTLQKYLAVYAQEKEKPLCYILPTGGVPACSTALLIQAVRLFQEQCHVIYQPEEGPVWPLEVGQQLSAVIQENSLITFLERFEFAAMRQIWRAQPAAGLLAYAHGRLEFDFDQALHHIQQTRRETKGVRAQKIRPLLDSCQQQLEALKTNEPKVMLAELFYNARITWDNGRWLDFLGRAVRFQEMALQYLTQRGDKADIRHFLLQTLANPAELALIQQTESSLTPLRERMEEKFNYSELQIVCFDMGINSERFPLNNIQAFILELVQYCQRRQLIYSLIVTLTKVNPQAGLEQLADFSENKTLHFYRSLARLQSLVALHHQTILGAGWQGMSGMSEELLKQHYPADYNPVQDMSNICTYFNISIQNPFRQIQEMLKELVGELLHE